MTLTQRTNSSNSATSVYSPNSVIPLERCDSDEVPEADTLSSLLINHLKNVLASENLPKNKKIQLLTVLPPNWSYRTITDTFPVTWRLVAAARSILQEEGILGNPNLKAGIFMKK